MLEGVCIRAILKSVRGVTEIGSRDAFASKNPENPEKKWGVCVIIIGREGLINGPKKYNNRSKDLKMVKKKCEGEKSAKK